MLLDAFGKPTILVLFTLMLSAELVTTWALIGCEEILTASNRASCLASIYKMLAFFQTI
jgi:hypothetical protein